MKIIGIICEYNPFHNGHLYHLQKIKELFPDSLIVLVLNGYFLQRGELSIISKENKTKLALEYGVDIVIELPFVFGTQSADIFASASIKILEELKCDYLVFGSESNNLESLQEMVNYTLSNSENYNDEVKEYLKKGFNYPTALTKAMKTATKFKSNDLLGISYIKSITINHYNIKPLTIKRTNDYLDITSNDNIISATNVRNKYQNDERISSYVPSSTLKYIQKISLDNYFSLLKYKIITDHDLSIYLDVDEGIENRLKKAINKASSLPEFIDLIKSKRYTYNKIRRMLIHILIGYTKEDNKNLHLEYIKILGFNSKGKRYLNQIKNKLNLPLTINKKSIIYQYEIKAAFMYQLLSQEKTLDYELTNKPQKKA